MSQWLILSAYSVQYKPGTYTRETLCLVSGVQTSPCNFYFVYVPGINRNCSCLQRHLIVRSRSRRRWCRYILFCLHFAVGAYLSRPGWLATLESSPAPLNVTVTDHRSARFLAMHSCPTTLCSNRIFHAQNYCV